jgi:hypothetical protein
MAYREYAAQWGRDFGFIWHYQVGGLSYRQVGYCFGKRRAKAKAMSVYNGR